MSIQANNVGNVLEICIARPEKRNAISAAMYQELTRLLDEANADKECAAVIVHGAGGHFTVGADINDFQTRRGNEDSPAVTLLRKMAAIDVPLIAAVEGLAIGIGATMLQHVDFAYASQDARFRMPFVSLGLCPEGASSYLHQYTTDALLPEDGWVSIASTTTTFTFKGLTRGVTYYVRSIAIGRNNQLKNSIVVNRVSQ